MLALIGALDEEVAILRGDMTVSAEATHSGITVTTGTYKDVASVLAKCGVGKVNAAICAQMLIDLYKPEAIAFSGVAGGLVRNMAVGDMVIASHLIQFDVDLTAFGRRHGELPDAQRMIESDPELVRIAGYAFDRAFPDADTAPGLMIGTVVSSGRLVKDSETLRWLQGEFSTLATEMEGAAVVYTCGLSGIPFVVIRGISDGAGETADTDFKANLHTVCQNSYRVLEEFVPLWGGLR